MHDPAAVKDLNIKIAPAPFTLPPNNNGGSGHCLIQTDRKAVLHIFLALRNNCIHLSVSLKISELFCDCFRSCMYCIFPGRTPDDLHIPWGTKQSRAGPAVLQQHAKWTWSQEKMGRQEGRQEPKSGWDMSHCFFFYAANSYTWGDCFDSVSVCNWEKRNQRHPCKRSSVVAWFVGFQSQGMF